MPLDNALFCQLVQARPSSRLWILTYFLLGLLTLSTSSSVIREIEAMCEAGHALISCFYSDFWDAHEQLWRDILPPFSLNFRLYRVLIVAFHHTFIRPTTKPRGNLVTMFLHIT